MPASAVLGLGTCGAPPAAGAGLDPGLSPGLSPGLTVAELITVFPTAGLSPRTAPGAMVPLTGVVVPLTGAALPDAGTALPACAGLAGCC